MSQVSLKPEVILTAINANLNHQFFASTRDHAKGLYNTLVQGKRLPLMTFDLGDNGEVYCELELDISEHVGKLNFGKFRKALALMMLSIHQRLETNAKLNAMSGNNGEVMFNIPGILKSDDVNVLVSSFRQLGPGLALIRIMYLDPVAYAEAAKLDLNALERNDDEPLFDSQSL